MSELQKLVIVFEDLCKNEDITHLQDMKVVDIYRYKIMSLINEMYDKKRKELEEIKKLGIDKEKLPF